MQFHGEILYDKGMDEAGNPAKDYWVHSDICFGCESETDEPLTEEHRKFLHDCLDEWLSNSNGTGIFFVGNPDTVKE